MAWYDSYFGGTTTPAATTSSSPPGQRVWEEDRRDEPTVSVDYTGPQDSQDSGTYLSENYGQDSDPIVSVNEAIYQPIDGRSAAIQTSQEERRLRDIQQLKSLYASTMSSPGPLGGANLEGLDLATIFGSFGTDPTVDPDDPSYNYANMPSGGQIPVTDWDKLNFLHHLGLGGTNITGKEGLGSLFAIDSSGNAILDSSGNLIKTGLGTEMSGKFNEIVYGTPSTFNPEEQLSMEDQFKKLEKDYWTAREEEDRGGSSAWDRYYDQEYGRTGSLSDLARNTWFSESLADVERREQARLDEGLGVATMADMEQMYDKEFAAKANPLFDPAFSLAATQEFDPGDIYGDLTLWQEAQKA